MGKTDKSWVGQHAAFSEALKYMNARQKGEEKSIYTPWPKFNDAATDGLEWNLKVTTYEVSHIISKFQKTFDAYWQSNDFELFDDSIHKEKLIDALKQSKFSKMLNICNIVTCDGFSFY